MENVESNNQIVVQETFSVAIVCYNNANLLKDCLDSILIQNYPAIEIIVADDKSNDFDAEKIKGYIEANKTDCVKSVSVYQNEVNLGTVKNVNTVISKTTGKYIKVIAADDKFHDENVLQKAKDALTKSKAGIIVGNVMKCDQNMLNPVRYKSKFQENLNKFEPHRIFKKLCVHNEIVACGVFFERRFFDTYGLYDENYKLMEDWPKWLEITKKGCSIVYHDFYTVDYRANGGIGTSINPVYMADKKRVLENIIIPSKKELGFFTYLKARISFKIINSLFIRKLYGKIFRKGKQ